MASSSIALGRPILFVIGNDLTTLFIHSRTVEIGRECLVAILRRTATFSAPHISNEVIPPASEPMKLFSSTVKECFDKSRYRSQFLRLNGANTLGTLSAILQKFKQQILFMQCRDLVVSMTQEVQNSAVS